MRTQLSLLPDSQTSLFDRLDQTESIAIATDSKPAINKSRLLTILDLDESSGTDAVPLCAVQPPKIINAKLAANFRTMADRLQSDIDNCLRDRPTHTRRMTEQARHSRLTGEKLQRIQTVMRELADGHEQGTVDPILSGINSKKQLEFLVPIALTYGEPDHEVEALGLDRWARWEDKNLVSIYDTAIDGYKDTRKFLVSAKINDSESLKAVLLAIKPMLSDSPQNRAKRKIKALEIQLNQSDSRYGYFPTPKPLVDRMLDLACIAKGMIVLEPSAGKGDIADELRNRGAEVYVAEIGYAQSNILLLKGHEFIGEDFLEIDPVNDELEDHFDRVVMNPPFRTPNDSRADESHIRHAFRFLKSGGRLVAIASASVKFRKDYAPFVDWIDSLGGSIDTNPEGSFKSSDRPTGVSTVMIVIDKN